MSRLFLTLCLLLGLVGCQPAPDPVLLPLDAWQLTGDDGAAFGSQQLEGDIAVVSFFFTSCATVCPMVHHAMQRLAAEPALAEGVRLIAISVDPAYDRPPVLQTYRRERGIGDDPRWTLVTGDSVDQVRGVVEGTFKLVMGDREALPGPEEGASNLYDISHAARLVLLDQAGDMRGLFGTEDEELARLHVQIERLKARPAEPS